MDLIFFYKYILKQLQSSNRYTTGSSARTKMSSPPNSPISPAYSPCGTRIRDPYIWIGKCLYKIIIINRAAHISLDAFHNHTLENFDFCGSTMQLEVARATIKIVSIPFPQEDKSLGKTAISAEDAFNANIFLNHQTLRCSKWSVLGDYSGSMELTWRQVKIITPYVKYKDQTVFPFAALEPLGIQNSWVPPPDQLEGWPKAHLLVEIWRYRPLPSDFNYRAKCYPVTSVEVIKHSGINLAVSYK